MENSWRAAYRLEGARLLQAWSSDEAVEGEAFAERLWCWAKWVEGGEVVGEGEGPAADSVAALCAAVQDDPIGVDGRQVCVARGLYAWGKVIGDRAVQGAGWARAEGVFSALDDYAAGRTELSVWVAVLALCGEVLTDADNRAVHLVAARCVAVLLNNFYQVERGEFLDWTEEVTSPGPVGQERAAELAVQIEAVDALLAEAMRCADERLWAWASALAERLAARVGADERAAETLRLPAARIGCRSGEAWAVDWVNRPWCEARGEVKRARLRSLMASVRLPSEM